MVIFLWLLAIGILIFLFLLAIITGKLRVEIKNLEIKNKEEWNLRLVQELMEELEKEELVSTHKVKELIQEKFFYIKYDFVISLYIFKFIRIFSLNANNKSVKIYGKKINKDKLIKKLQAEEIKISLKDKIKLSKRLIPSLKNFELYMKLGTDNPILSAFLVYILNTLLTIFLTEASKKSKLEEIKKWRYLIMQNNFIQNSLNLILSCIIEWKLVHIMYMFSLLKKGRVKKNGKSSNRRTNEKCYG